MDPWRLLDELTEPWGQKVGGGVGEIEKRNESTSFLKCVILGMFFWGWQSRRKI